MKTICPHCNQEYPETPDEYLGKTVECRNCRKDFVCEKPKSRPECSAVNPHDVSAYRQHSAVLPRFAPPPPPPPRPPLPPAPPPPPPPPPPLPPAPPEEQESSEIQKSSETRLTRPVSSGNTTQGSKVTKTVCPHCNQEFPETPEEYLGMTLECPVCHQNFVCEKPKFCSECSAANPHDVSVCRQRSAALPRFAAPPPPKPFELPTRLEMPEPPPQKFPEVPRTRPVPSGDTTPSVPTNWIAKISYIVGWFFISAIILAIIRVVTADERTAKAFVFSGLLLPIWISLLPEIRQSKLLEELTGKRNDVTKYGLPVSWTILIFGVLIYCYCILLKNCWCSVGEAIFGLLAIHLFMGVIYLLCLFGAAMVLINVKLLGSALPSTILISAASVLFLLLCALLASCEMNSGSSRDLEFKEAVDLLRKTKDMSFDNAIDYWHKH